MGVTSRIFIVLVACLALAPLPAHSSWSRSGTQVTLNATLLYGNSMDSVYDGFGGVVFVFEHGSGIWAQRVDAFGVVQWAADGVVVCGAPNNQFRPRVVADGTGGVIVAWSDDRNGTLDIYAQRLTSNGTSQWTNNGVLVCDAIDTQDNPILISDASARAIIAWEDYRNGNYDVYAQRLNSAGTPQWAPNGAPVIVYAGIQRNPEMVVDGSGGVIVVWEDDTGSGYNLYAQRLNISGVMQWASSGVPVCTEVEHQTDQRLVADGAGGVVVTWTDHRSGTHNDVYVQRVNSVGISLWIAQGTPLTTSTNNQQAAYLVTDGSGGFIVAWYDNTATLADGYAQRISASGSTLWAEGGVPILVNAGNQYTAALEAVPGGGALAIYTDYASTTNRVIAQRVDNSGTPLWPLSGVPVRTGYANDYASHLASDGRGGFVATIIDGRNGGSGEFELAAQRVEPRFGEWGFPEPVLQSVLDNPADQGGKVVVKWSGSDRDVFSEQLISHYSIWRSTDAAVASAVSGGDKNSQVVTDPKDVGPDFTGAAVYAAKDPGAAAAYWEWVANQDAAYLPSYSYTAATRQDSVAGEPAVHYFKILSHARLDPTHIWESADMAGYSVDNLAPAAPLMLTAQRVGSDVHLKWNRVHVVDLRDYSVYRASATGVTPVPGNFLSSSDDTVLVDTSAPAAVLYYIVTAYDVHDNQSAPSNEANVGGSTGVGNTPIPTSLTLQSNVPNPFSTETTLRIGLPAASDVNVEIYDVAGRRVAARTLAGLSAGWREVVFDGRDDRGRSLASGVYFSRVTAAGETRTQKLVIRR